MRSALGLALILLWSGLAAACAAGRGGWSWRALEARHPELREHRGGRLADAMPYFFPRRSEQGSKGQVLQLFLCRFPTTSPIRVSLPPEATPAESVILRRALSIWSEMDLGVRFEERTNDAPGAVGSIEIRFVDVETDGSGVPLGSADTVSDCELPRGPQPQGHDRPLPAQLRSASIHLRRTQTDVLGRSVPLSEEELVGAALHELGHALGFQGHASRGNSVMVRNVEKVRSIGRRALMGEEFADRSLQALYAIPSGTVVGELRLPEDAATILNEIADRAQAEFWQGPFVRVGDRSARLFWRDAAGAEIVLRIADWVGVLRNPEGLSWQPNQRARRELLRGLDPLGSSH